jgi:two-component system sensor histidine kinase DesK
VGWAVPWLFFLAFPIADLVGTPRPVLARAVATGALATFAISYLTVFSRAFTRGCPRPRPHLLIVVVLGVALPVWLGTSWTGLLIYVSAAVASSLPERWVWPAVLGAAAISAGVIAWHGQFPDLFILPLMCLLTAMAQERLRFARGLHDLLGHSLSLIALKSELAGRLAELDPARARTEMADVEAAARRALAEVRDAVSGYRQVSLAQAQAEARSALFAAGITLRTPAPAEPLPGAVDAVLGWVVREATTNVLRHSGARSVTVELARVAGDVTLTVTDDGHGTAGEAGAGLSGLAERVEGLGGRLTTGVAGSSGFRLTVVLPAAREHRPDVALLDIEMPGGDGIEAARALAAEVPGCRAVILTTFGRPGFLRRAMEVGAAGFLVKDAPVAVLARGMCAVMAGERVIDRDLAAAALAIGATPLSSREADVLRAAADGATVAGIAGRLFLSEGTVRNYLSSAIGKTGARTRVEAARVAEEKGWL